MFSPFFGGHLPAMTPDIPFVLGFYSSSLLAFWYSCLFSGIYFACLVGSHPGGYFAILLGGRFSFRPLASTCNPLCNLLATMVQHVASTVRTVSF